MSDTADTEPNDDSFSNANAHSESSLSPDQDLSSPHVRDGPGRKCSPNIEFNKERVNTHTLLVRYFIADVFFLFFLFFLKGYELFAFISHMGTSTMSGHYVCHIKKEGRYADYNVCYLFTPFHFVSTTNNDVQL